MRFLKFDILYPPEYLQHKQAESIEIIKRMNFDEYYNWLMGLKMGYYDMFQKYYHSKGWDAYDFFYQDDIFVNKLAQKYKLNPTIKDFTSHKGFGYWADLPLKYLIKAWKVGIERKELKKRIILRKFINLINPDILFLREPCQIDNMFWQPYKHRMLIATMIGCNIGHPRNWMLHTSDLVFTITPEFCTFFNLNRVDSYLFEYGFDIDLINDLKVREKKYDVSFVGILGTKDQENKTLMMEAIAEKFSFHWWGPKGDDLKKYPNLLRTWQGFVAGLEMYQIYADSKIVVNEYVHSNGNMAVNLRLKEVMGVGTCLITRIAENIRPLKKANAVIFFSDATDCFSKIDYYLRNDTERNMIAANAQQYVINHFSNTKVLDDIQEKLEKHYNEKFINGKPNS